MGIILHKKHFFLGLFAVISQSIHLDTWFLRCLFMLFLLTVSLKITFVSFCINGILCGASYLFAYLLYRVFYTNH